MSDELTKDPAELWKRWAKVYLNICVLRTRNKTLEPLLDELKNKAIMFNEFFSDWTDRFEAAGRLVRANTEEERRAYLAAKHTAS